VSNALKKRGNCSLNLTLAVNGVGKSNKEIAKTLFR
jgi:hypothetical protein